MNDKLTNCLKCGSQICYESQTEHITTWLCMGCGFTTNTLMKKDSEYLNESLNLMPELYKDLQFEDLEGKVWFPSTLNFPKQGIVFANGTDKNNWRWAGVQAVPVEESEKEKFKIPEKENEYYSHRIEMKTMQIFEQTDFIDAADYIGIFSKEALEN
jgi:hypothetical protein